MNDSFWGRVLYLLDCKDIPRKEFVRAVGISYSSIHNGCERNSIPSADVALKIADFLETSIEYLVYGNAATTEAEFQQSRNVQKNERLLYRKNKDIIDALETMPLALQNAIRELILHVKQHC